MKVEMNFNLNVAEEITKEEFEEIIEEHGDIEKAKEKSKEEVMNWLKETLMEGSFVMSDFKIAIEEDECSCTEKDCENCKQESSSNL